MNKRAACPATTIALLKLDAVVAWHSGKHYTDANATLHPLGDSMAEPESPSYASRSAGRMYRTSPLRGVWQHCRIPATVRQRHSRPSARSTTPGARSA